jgi:DNA-binding transcriptional ArsR family regulator
MSKSLSPIVDDELVALTGGAFVPNHTTAGDDIDVASATRRIRAQLQAAAAKAGVGVRELAARLKVSPSAVSRHLRSDGDIRVSTAVLLAGALDMKWEMKLVAKPVTVVLDAAAVLPSAIQRRQLPQEVTMTIFSTLRHSEEPGGEAVAVREMRPWR